MGPLCCAVAAVGIHLQSAHLDQEPWLREGGVNDANYGAYVELDNGATLGTYRNTLSRQSVYAGYTNHFLKVEGVRFSVTVGGITGYTHQTLTPALIPSVSAYITNGWYGRLVYVPKTEFTGAHVLHTVLEKRFE